MHKESRACSGCGHSAPTPTRNLLGPLKATHFGVGDVEGFDSRLTGSLAAGRGCGGHQPAADRANGVRPYARRRRPADRLGSRALSQRRAARLCQARPSQRYVFDNVQLLYGENRIRVVLYGPQGQVRSATRCSMSAQDDVPKGKTWYWVGANEPGRDLITLEKPPDAAGLPKAQAAVSVEHGLDARTSVGVLARAMLIGDQRLTFVEGTVRRSVGPAQVAVSAARESNGGTAAHAQILGKFGAGLCQCRGAYRE